MNIGNKTSYYDPDHVTLMGCPLGIVHEAMYDFSFWTLCWTGWYTLPRFHVIVYRLPKGKHQFQFVNQSQACWMGFKYLDV